MARYLTANAMPPVAASMDPPAVNHPRLPCLTISATGVRASHAAHPRLNPTFRSVAAQALEAEKVWRPVPLTMRRTGPWEASSSRAGLPRAAHQAVGLVASEDVAKWDLPEKALLLLTRVNGDVQPQCHATARHVGVSLE